MMARLLAVLAAVAATAIFAAAAVAATHPAAPTNVAATVSGATVTITADASTEPDFSYFAVRYSNDPASDKATWTRLPGNHPGPLSVTHQPGYGTFYYYVTAIDTAGNVSDRSSVAAATVNDPAGAPDAPTGLRAVLDEEVYVLLSTDPSSESDYSYTAFRRGPSATGPWTRLDGNHVTPSTVDSPGPGRWYYYATANDTQGLYSARTPVVDVLVPDQTTPEPAPRPAASWEFDGESGSIIPPYSTDVTRWGTALNSSASLATSTDRARAGTRSAKLTLPPSGGSSSRWQQGTGVTMRNGEEHWMGVSVYLPESFDLAQVNNGADYFAIIGLMRWTGSNSGTYNGPGGGLGLRRVNPATGGANDSYPVQWRSGILNTSPAVNMGAPVKGAWTDFMQRIRWSTGSDGFMEWWRDGVYRGRYDGPTMMASTSRTGAVTPRDMPITHRFGMYQGGSVTQSRTIYWDNHRLGKSYAEVDPAA